MITAVVFDLDDTLYDEIDYCRSGLSAVAGFLSNNPNHPPAERVFNTLWSQFTDGNRTKTFNAALDELNINYDDKRISELVNIYRNHVPHITLPQDSREVLCKLKSKYTLALLTDGFLSAQQLKVQALGIEEYFCCIVYTEQLGRVGRDCWKPSPAGFEKIMQDLDTNPENMVYVADNEKKDFIAPNKLGFLTVKIIRPASIHTESSQESDAAAKHTIHQISQLPALLEEI